MSEQFNELFRIPFAGSVSTLQGQLESLDGIERASLKTRHEVVDTDLLCELVYDAYATDRTAVAQQIERLDGTGDVLFA